MWDDKTNIGSDNDLSPSRRQAIICTNAGMLSIGHLGTNFSEILIEIHTFLFKKMHLKRSSGNGGHFVLASMCYRKYIRWQTQECNKYKANEIMGYTSYITGFKTISLEKHGT